MFRGASVRSTTTRMDGVETGLAAKETTLISRTGINENRRTCGDSVKKDRRESKGERWQGASAAASAVRCDRGRECARRYPGASVTRALCCDNGNRRPPVRSRAEPVVPVQGLR